MGGATIYMAEHTRAIRMQLVVRQGFLRFGQTRAGQLKPSTWRRAKAVDRRSGVRARLELAVCEPQDRRKSGSWGSGVAGDCKFQLGGR